ncbi:hypothetical protein BD310DRAFT_223071 [Dichomitus squalens]|uniref:Uncharacterized protein n=1 Tax=Dichomitus squalens TaxID=114155 RepID=A0A4Q9PCQ6_9APHY|nr:hypothetical protein BD310DRAFT_223071 [Dichomitus squalens]
MIVVKARTPAKAGVHVMTGRRSPPRAHLSAAAFSVLASIAFSALCQSAAAWFRVSRASAQVHLVGGCEQHRDIRFAVARIAPA